jgi:hypothetical protein
VISTVPPRAAASSAVANIRGMPMRVNHRLVRLGEIVLAAIRVRTGLEGSRMHPWLQFFELSRAFLSERSFPQVPITGTLCDNLRYATRGGLSAHYV